MSWLARSLASTLLIHDDDDHPHPTSSNANHHHSQSQEERLDTHQEIKDSEIEDQDRTGGVKEDLSELKESLTRQLWGVASFLAPPASQPPSHRYSTTTSHSDPPAPDPYVSGEDDDHASNSADDQSRIGVGNGISDSSRSATSHQTEKIEAVGVTEEALAFARNISHHPETWLDFPLSDEEDNDDFEMSDTQWNHVSLVERQAPRLAALRIELCPTHMSESYFWKVYFVLLHPRLNKHDADLLSTPQIFAARNMWVKELQKRTNSVHEDLITSSSEFPCEFESATHHHRVKEEGLIKAPLDHRTSSCSYTIPIDDYDEDDDDWVHENSELNGYIGPHVHIGTDEDISFSDLEADDDCTMPIRSKII